MKLPKLVAVNSKIVPPGTYYVGDPCYVFEHDNWIDLLDAICNLGGDLSGNKVYVSECGLIWMHQTEFGDGQYLGYGSMISGGHFMFPVDAGVLGLVDVRYISEEKREYADGLGVFIEVSEPSYVNERNWVIEICGITINTGSDESDNEDELDEEFDYTYEDELEDEFDYTYED